MVSIPNWEEERTISLLWIIQRHLPVTNHRQLPVEAFTLTQVHTSQGNSRNNEIVTDSEAVW